MLEIEALVLALVMVPSVIDGLAHMMSQIEVSECTSSLGRK